MKFFTDDERTKYQDVDRRRILQKDRVCGGSVLGGPNKKEKEYRIDDASYCTEKVYAEAAFSRQNKHRQGGQK